MRPPPSAVVSGQVESTHPSRFANPIVAGRSDVEMAPAPTTPPELFGTGRDIEQVGQSSAATASGTISIEEPEAKRATVLQVNDIEMHHMDVDPVEFFDDECMDSFNDLALDDGEHFNSSFNFEPSSELDLECLWKPSTALEPVVDPIELQAI